MLEEYDIDKLNPRPNPYAKELKKQITIKIAPSVIDYFKGESKETGIPYQTLIKTMTIGKNIKKIGKNAFRDCKKLKTVTIKTSKLTSGSPNN